MSDVLNRENEILEASQRPNTVPPEADPAYADADGTMGTVAGTGLGAVSGGVVGAVMGGPVGAVVGAVAGGLLGSAAGDAAHNIGDDHDDLNVSTGSSGELGRDSGAAAGAVSGAVLGTAAGGPLGGAIGATAGGMLGAGAGDAAKHMGEDTTPLNPAYDPIDAGADNNYGELDGERSAGYQPTTGFPVAGTGLDNNYGSGHLPDDTNVTGPTSVLPGVQTGGRALDGSQDTRGITEKAADAVTGDVYDDKTGRQVR